MNARSPLRRIAHRWIRPASALLLGGLLLQAAPTAAQRLEPVGRVPADADAGPILARLAALHGGPLLVIRDRAYRVPTACLPDAADRGGASGDAAPVSPDGPGGGPWCRLAVDRTGFWLEDAEQTNRLWYYDAGALRRIHGEFVALRAHDLAPGGRAREGRRADASEIASIFNLGVRAYQAGSDEEARDAFTRAAAMDPHFRDAVFYQLLALDRLQAWEQMITAGERTLELDPLNQTALLLLARAYARAGDGGPQAARRRELRARLGELPVFLSAGAGLSPSCSLTGTLLGGSAAPGAAVPLRVVLRRPDGEQTVVNVEVAAPARGEAVPLALPLGAHCGEPGTRMRYTLGAAEG